MYMYMYMSMYVGMYVGMSRRDRGDLELRSQRCSEQLEAMWRDLANERRERQVEMNEERMARGKEQAELHKQLEKLTQEKD